MFVHFVGSYGRKKKNLDTMDVFLEAFEALSICGQKVNRDFGAPILQKPSFESEEQHYFRVLAKKPKTQPSTQKVNQNQPGPHGQLRGQTQRHYTLTHA